MKTKRALVALFAAAMLVVSASQAMAETNSNLTSGSVDLTNAPLQNESVTPFKVTTAVDAGGGQWDYGTSPVFGWGISKQVWSNYNHPKYYHSSSCSIGTTESHSGSQRGGNTAYSSATGERDAKTHAYWKVEDGVE
ncbi:lactococcin 972 family bacteriocin [Paenibacillus brasilensis]|uniref:Lactococcin 972 family bacteriocin n=1 Tax=Paenibacillus brasilensis TaxID=128574 RepID=A0ABU0L1D9_9BACL|nr:lactococcin 972 family bacteriocin [Paenibacillus brasilensis]MDQ0495496.1 hypothetical protein [Paenibacillus brasilensis]